MRSGLNGIVGYPASVAELHGKGNLSPPPTFGGQKKYRKETHGRNFFPVPTRDEVITPGTCEYDLIWK